MAISIPNHPIEKILFGNLVPYERLSTIFIPIVINPPRQAKKVHGFVSTNRIRSVSGESMRTPKIAKRYPLVRRFNKSAGILGYPIRHMDL